MRRDDAYEFREALNFYELAYRELAPRFSYLIHIRARARIRIRICASPLSFNFLRETRGLANANNYRIEMRWVRDRMSTG